MICVRISPDETRGNFHQMKCVVISPDELRGNFSIYWNFPHRNWVGMSSDEFSGNFCSWEFSKMKCIGIFLDELSGYFCSWNMWKFLQMNHMGLLVQIIWLGSSPDYLCAYLSKQNDWEFSKGIEWESLQKRIVWKILKSISVGIYPNEVICSDEFCGNFCSSIDWEFLQIKCPNY